MPGPVRRAAGCWSSGCCSEGWSVTAAAAAAGVSERTVWRWLKRSREDAQVGLLDRSSRPQPLAEADSVSDASRRSRALRKLRMTAAQIAESLGLALSTVSAWLKRIALGKRSRLEPPEPRNRYERRHPGELMHVDIKQLRRIYERRHQPPRGRQPAQPARSPRPRACARGVDALLENVPRRVDATPDRLRRSPRPSARHAARRSARVGSPAHRIGGDPRVRAPVRRLPAVAGGWPTPLRDRPQPTALALGSRHRPARESSSASRQLDQMRAGHDCQHGRSASVTDPQSSAIATGTSGDHLLGAQLGRRALSRAAWRDARGFVGHLGVDRGPRGVEQTVGAVALVHREERFE